MRRPNLAVSTSLVQDNIPAPIECCNKIYIGSIHAAFNIDKIKELGITHILNASGLPPTYPKSFSYLSVEVRDKSYASILGCIPATNIFIEAGLEQGGGVLVHCAGGRSRSAALIMSYLMSSQKLDFDTALAYCVKARDLVNVNPGFQIQLRAYAAADCDVHTAHQILLHKRLERFGERLHRNFKASSPSSSNDTISEEKEEKTSEGLDNNEDDNRSVVSGISVSTTTISTPSDEFGLNKSTKFEAKVESVLSLLDSPSSTVQPRLRLSRPHSPAIQVIPPLRALERKLSCRRCSYDLFSYANIVLLDINHSRLDHVGWAQEYVMKHSKGIQPFASPSGLTQAQGFRQQQDEKNHKSAVAALNMVGLDLADESPNVTPVPPASTRGDAAGSGGFGRQSNKNNNESGGGGFGRSSESGGGGGGFGRSSESGGGGGGGFGRNSETIVELPRAEAKEDPGSPKRETVDAKETSDSEPPSSSQLPAPLNRASSNESFRTSPVNYSCGNRYDVRRTSFSPSLSISSSPSASPSSATLQNPSTTTADALKLNFPQSTNLSLRSVPAVISQRRNSAPNSARSSNSNWSVTPPDSARSNSNRQRNFRPQSAEKERWLRRLQVLEHPNMIRTDSGDGSSGNGDGSSGNGSTHQMITSAEALRISDRALRIAQADEECQRALHSQVDTRPWRSIHQHYREAVSALETPESPLKLTDVNSPPMVEGEVWNSEGAMDLGSTPKAFFLEPMPWMKLEALQNGTKLEGPLTCPGCQCELGSYRFDDSPSSSSSSPPVPRFIVMRRFVCANALPSEVHSSRESTPRDNTEASSGVVHRARSDTALLRLSDSEAKMTSSSSFPISNLKKDGDDDE